MHISVQFTTLHLLYMSSIALAELACPDEESLRLLDLARHPSENADATPSETYAYVIKSAIRPMDEPALRTACRRLARSIYFSENYSPGANPYGPLPQPDAVERLTVENPLLMKCPKYSIGWDAKLPTTRYQPQPTTEIVEHELTGWVQLELETNAHGYVESISALDASHPMLVEIAIDAASKFEYQPGIGPNLEPIGIEGVLATVIVDYFDLARAKGCEWKAVGY